MFSIFATIIGGGQDWQEKPGCPQCVNCKKEDKPNGYLDMRD